MLLDYGIKPTVPPQYPLNGINPRSVVVSHGHLDHCGIVPNLMDLEPEIYMTPMTKSLTGLLARDTLKISRDNGLAEPFLQEEILDFERKTKTVEYNRAFNTSGYMVEFFDAGHIPGSSSVYLERDGTSLFYSGDINTRDTRLLRKAAGDYPCVDALILESTYYGRDHPPRGEVEKAFVDSVEEVLDSGGFALVPCFAIGRTQEILMILYSYGLSCYVDGMGIDVYELIQRYPESVRDINLLKAAFRNASCVEPETRSKLLEEPSIIVTTAGMLNGGPVLYYISKIYRNPRSKIFLTGYQVEGTNGRNALDRGYIEIHGDIMHLRCGLEKYDFSAHSGDSELREVARGFCSLGAEKVFLLHGEDTKDFAAWIQEELGVNAYAPTNGEEISF